MKALCTNALRLCQLNQSIFVPVGQYGDIKMLFDVTILEEYKTENQTKPKEKIQLQDIKEIKQKIIPKKELQQPQKKNEYLKKFTIESYLSDIQLPPKNIPWIEHLLKWKPKAKQYELLKQYKELYLQAYDNTPLEHQKINAGTLKANTWLRVLITGE
ncbi:hypothetical protein [Candidatus Francisella endociliophora]|nr:hypothetical protein [Francisella sp. FSC1006]